jgi:hypothetical protein
MVAHSGLPVWPPWLALVAQASWAAGLLRLAPWYLPRASEPQLVEPRAVAPSEPPEKRIERERAVPEP